MCSQREREQTRWNVWLLHKSLYRRRLFKSYMNFATKIMNGYFYLNRWISLHVLIWTQLAHDKMTMSMPMIMIVSLSITERCFIHFFHSLLMDRERMENLMKIGMKRKIKYKSYQFAILLDIFLFIPSIFECAWSRVIFKLKLNASERKLFFHS